MSIKKYKNKISKGLITAVMCALIFTSCTTQSNSEDKTASETNSTPITVNYDSEDLNSDWNESEAIAINLNEDGIQSQGEGAVVENNKVTIVSGGTYLISGTLKDGQIVVKSQDKQTVRLILNGVTIHCNNNAPISIEKSEKTVITLADDTENTISDGETYKLESGSDEPNAALFSKDDLTINGSGTLTVNGNYKSGILSKDELKIVSGNININSATDGLRGRDYIAVKDGKINIVAKSDGIQSNNDEDTSKGFVYIEGGSLSIDAGDDGIQAETKVLVKKGDITIKSGGGNENGLSHKDTKPDMNNNTSTTQTSTDTESSKGIKAGVDITVEDGNIIIDSSDDSIHSNDSITINGGKMQITSGDDGIHSDTTMTLNGGEVNIKKSYEGIESSSITLNGGTFAIIASDDGINTAGGNDGSSTNGRPGQNNFTEDDGSKLIINGGQVSVDATGDGIDVNGSIVMTGGTIFVYGPTNDGNAALDYNSSFEISGGYLIAAGSSGMAQAPSTTSKQNSVIVNLDSVQKAGTLFHLEDESGKNILTFAPKKDYQSVIISSANLEKGTTYTVYTGGKSTGTEKNGTYEEGTYSGGTKITSFKIEDSVTQYGTSSRNTMGGGNGPKGNFSDKEQDPGKIPTDGDKPAPRERPDKNNTENTGTGANPTTSNSLTNN